MHLLQCFIEQFNLVLLELSQLIFFNRKIHGNLSILVMNNHIFTDYYHIYSIVFFLWTVIFQRAEASRQKCQLLNPNVELHVDTSDISEKDEQFFASFDLIILVDQKYTVVDRISKICRDARKP